MSILAEKLGAAGRRVLDAVMPQDCLLCAAPAGGTLLCPTCAAELPRMPAPTCPHCALPTSSGETCGRCLRHPPHFERLLACFPYAFPVDRMLQQLKYSHQLALARWFGEQLTGVADGLACDLIVPMPLHPQRLRERGFNQALEIARPLARHTDVRLSATSCVRNRDTAPQEGLTLLQRRRNLKNAFACNTDFSGLHVLLVDDVVTTGASVSECARTLRLHGAESVTVLAVARTLLD